MKNQPVFQTKTVPWKDVYLAEMAELAGLTPALLYNKIKKRNAVCFLEVSYVEEEVFGFAVFELFGRTIHISYLVTDNKSNHLMQQMLDNIISRLSVNGRYKITCEVREDNLEVLNFYKKNHFSRVTTVKELDESDLDWILFEYNPYNVEDKYNPSKNAHFPGEFAPYVDKN
jgi:ribosomal protein S18 acetylase RimI-like enzyme